jgi:LuxR family maltose regulon positive regulatory protein
MPQAIRHALLAEDYERAADLIEMVWREMQRARQEALLLGWLRALPDMVLRFRPVLSVEYAGTLLANGLLDGVEARLQDAERCLHAITDSLDAADMTGRTREQPGSLSADRNETDKIVIVDQEEFRRVPGSIAMYRAAHALALGDLSGAVTHARRVLDLVPEDDSFRHGAVGSILGLAAWARGDLEEAYRSYAGGMAHLQKIGGLADAVGGAFNLADMRIAQGRLREAMRLYERGLQLATQGAKEGSPVLKGTADMHVGMGELYREQNDLDAATEHLLKSKELGEHMGLPKYPYRWCVAMSRLREAHGDLDGALELLGEAERLYLSDFSPDVRPIAAMKTRVWIAQGRLREALEWVRERGLSPEDDLSYIREFEHITLARLLLAQYRAEHRNGGDCADRSSLEALGPAEPTVLMGLLDRLLSAAEAGGRAGSAVEVLILQALTHHACGDISAALVPLQRALTLAEPEGFVRIFVDEGLPMSQLLSEVAARGITPDYAGKLLQSFDRIEGRQQKGSPDDAGKSADEFPLTTSRFTPGPSSSATSTSQPLIEPLSQRELEILRLFRTELSGPEIADQLVIALSTVRTHTKGIYGKLNVTSRREAVKRASELGLI